MIIEFKEFEGKGKTLGMVAFALYLVLYEGYSFSEIYSNVKIKVPTTNYMKNEQLKEYLGSLVKEHKLHKIVLADEIDSLFPHRYFNQRKQTDNLLGIWQIVKQFSYLLYTNHMTLGADNLLRDSTHAIIAPEFDKENDTLYLIGFNFLHNVPIRKSFPNVSRIFKYYDRWQNVD